MFDAPSSTICGVSGVYAAVIANCQAPMIQHELQVLTPTIVERRRGSPTPHEVLFHTSSVFVEDNHTEADILTAFMTQEGLLYSNAG